MLPVAAPAVKASLYSFNSYYIQGCCRQVAPLFSYKFETGFTLTQTNP